MILNTITLHNFMSYADATLDLSAVSVACLSGSNGAGKSALLDALTWALWGASRASSDDELIRLGEKEMWVDITFAHESERYRVRRARHKSATKSGARGISKATLELQVWDPRLAELPISEPSLDEGQLAAVSAVVGAGTARGKGAPAATRRRFDADGLWRSLSAGRVSETEESVRKLLRMNYDTFINSAYLRQGRADEFTTRARSERKQVLSEILGLSYFDDLQEGARDRVKELRAKHEWLESAILALSQTESERLEVEVVLLERQEKLDQASAVVSAKESQVETLQRRVHTLTMTEERAESADKQLSALAIDVTNIAERESELAHRTLALVSLLERTGEIEEAMQAFERTKAELGEQDRKALTTQEMNARRLELQTSLARQRSVIELDLENNRRLQTEARTQIERLEKDTAGADKINETYRNFKELVRLEADLSRRQEAFVQLTQRSGDLNAAVGEARIRLEADVEQKRIAVSELKEILLSKDSLEGFWRALKEEAEGLDKVEAEFALVEERGLAIKTGLESVEMKVAELKRRQKENRDKTAELTCHADSSICPLCSAPIVDRAAVVGRYKTDNDQIETDISSLRQESAGMENERNLLRKEYVALKQKLETRKELDVQIGQYNERLLAVERAQESLVRLTNELEATEKSLAQQDFAQIERESLVALMAEIHKLEFDPVQFSTIQSQLRSQRYIETKHAQLHRDLVECKRVRDQMPKLDERNDELLNTLTSESYGSEIRNQVHTLQEQLSELGYNSQNHADLKVRLTQLMSATEQYRQLKQASDELPALEETLSGCRALLQSKREQIPLLSESLVSWREELKKLPQAQSALEQLKPELSSARSQRDELAQAQAVTRAKLEQLDARLNELTQKRSMSDELRNEIDDYVVLAEAFGKKGIQAVIIENAIPEIEAEANRLLARLSDNKMHVAFVTQQRTKAGGITETLDLLIGDEIGTRAYELYSGGEAFKVNFAIRVALSRLLARRSGAKLETLIIDEGFGSQDDASREKLVRAIRSIQPEFACILVITHMPDVREMFPVQIHVSKQRGSSELTILS